MKAVEVLETLHAIFNLDHKPAQEKDMRSVGAFEAKNRLGQLLDWVEAGEEVIITRHGKTVAWLVPPCLAADHDKARAAATAIRAMSQGVTLGGLSLRDLVAEGRR